MRFALSYFCLVADLPEAPVSHESKANRTKQQPAQCHSAGTSSIRPQTCPYLMKTNTYLGHNWMGFLLFAADSLPDKISLQIAIRGVRSDNREEPIF